MNVASYGLRAWRGRAGKMPRAHAHTDIELNLVLAGHVRYFMGGRFETVPPKRLAVLWAGIPHQAIEVGRDTEFIWVTVPLAWFMQWQGGQPLAARLLGGELVVETDRRAAELDETLVTRWVKDLRQPSAEVKKTVLLEVEARLRRLARTIGRPRPVADGGGQIERITCYIGQWYEDEALAVGQIAEAVKLHPNYLMQLFKRQCGMSLWEYVLRLRVSHAQRLLITTDKKIVDVALESGFASPSRFYEAFGRYCGRAPQSYRAAQRLA